MIKSKSMVAIAISIAIRKTPAKNKCTLFNIYYTILIYVNVCVRCNILTIGTKVEKYKMNDAKKTEYV